jgi:phosphate-selective porin OprO/OprP
LPEKTTGILGPIAFAKEAPNVKLNSAWVSLSSLVILFLLLFNTPQAVAQTAGSDQETFRRIWRFAEWHRDDQNPVLQSVLFSGRFQYEYAALDADQGDHDEWNVRRLRLGVKSRLFQKLTLHGEVELNPQERDPLYVRFTDLYAQWTSSDALELTVGKQGVPFTMDGSTSSKELLTIDRSNLANNMWFPTEYIPGVNVSGEVSGWLYQLGVYSGGEANREFGDFSGSAFTLASIGRDLGDSLGVGEAVLTTNYIYQNPDAGNTFTRQLHHMVSVNLRLTDEKWGIRTDVSGAAGYLGQSDLWGVMAMPFYNVTPKFQLVVRETFLKSRNPNGVRLATYENRLVPGRGDRYQEIYGGANYYFFGHKLKLQSGVQFGNMDDTANDGGAFSGVAWTTGLRVSW